MLPFMNIITPSHATATVSGQVEPDARLFTDLKDIEVKSR